jgi:hypothetical protein
MNRWLLAARKKEMAAAMKEERARVWGKRGRREV